MPRQLLLARGAVRARLLDERLEERRVLARLRMPLHADREAQRRILDRPRASRPLPTRSRRALPPRARGPGGGARSRRSAAPTIAASREPSFISTGCSANAPGTCLCSSCPIVLGQVLDEVAAARDVQELEAAADRERRHVALERGLQQRQLARVAARLRRVGLGMRLGAVRARVDVRAAGEDDPVERVERLLDALLAGRDEQRPPSRALDRVDVVERDRARPAGARRPSSPPARTS